MMKFKTGQEWFDGLIPEGLAIPSSTLVSGAGGSGKPLVGFLLVSSWLKKGGNLIFILTSTGRDFVEKAMKRLLKKSVLIKGNKFVTLNAVLEHRDPETLNHTIQDRISLA